METNLRIPEQPDQKKYDRTVKTIKAGIKALESKMKSVSYKAPERDKYVTQRGGLCTNLSQVCDEMQIIKNSKQATNTLLLAINKEIQSKSEVVTKLQAKLPYKSSQKVDGVIGRLQAQLGQRNVKLREEKQLVAEIDALNSCKKNISEYHTKKSELDEMQIRQKAYRADRERHNGEISSLKLKETQIKKRLESLRQEEDQEWKEYRAKFSEQEQFAKTINEMYQKKRELSSRFHMEKQAWLDYSSKNEVAAKKGIAKRTAVAESRRGRIFQNDSLEHSVGDCDTLLCYLKKCLPPPTVEAAGTPMAEPPTKPPVLNASSSSGPVGEFLLDKDGHKEESDDICFGLVRKTSKRSKRGRRQATASENSTKKLFHNSAVFSRFLSLDIDLPLTSACVPRCIECVMAKKLQLLALLDCERKSQAPTVNLVESPLPSPEAEDVNDSGTISRDHGDTHQHVGHQEVSLQTEHINDVTRLPQPVSPTGSNRLTLPSLVEAVEGKSTGVPSPNSPLTTDNVTPTSTESSDNHHVDNQEDDGDEHRDWSNHQSSSRCVPGGDHLEDCSISSGLWVGDTNHVTSYAARRCRSLDSFHTSLDSPRFCTRLCSASVYGGSQREIRWREEVTVRSES